MAQTQAPTSESPVSDRPGPEKAALWLLSIEEELAVQILPHLEEEEVRMIADRAREIEGTNPDELSVIHAEFSRVLSQDPLCVHGSVGYLTKITGRALGRRKAAQLVEGESVSQRASKLREADLEVLASSLRREHPQVISAVIATLTPDRASRLLLLFDAALRGDVIRRVANLSRIPHEALAQAEKLLAMGIPADLEGTDFDGVQIAATLLNQIDGENAEEILDRLSSGEDEVADNIRKAMFVFEDLVALDQRGFQALLKEVESDQLKIALKTASPELSEGIFSALSKRAGDMLREDLEVMGPVRISDVQKAQEAIVAAAVQLKDKGEIDISSSGEDFV